VCVCVCVVTCSVICHTQQCDLASIPRCLSVSNANMLHDWIEIEMRKIKAGENVTLQMYKSFRKII